MSGFPSEATPDAELAEFEAAFDYHLEHGRGQATIITNARLAAIETLLSEHRTERERWQQERAAQEEKLEHSRHALAQAQHERDAAASKSAAQSVELVPHLIYLAAWAASAALILFSGVRRQAGALIGVGVSAVTLGLFFADLGTPIADGANLRLRRTGQKARVSIHSRLRCTEKGRRANAIVAVHLKGPI